MSDKPQFQTGERVKCYHGPIMYTAKCVKYELRDDEHYYFIHYEGWNKNWDEWVPENRVQENTDEVKIGPKRYKAAPEPVTDTPSKEVTVGRKRKKEIDSDDSNPSTPTGGDSTTTAIKHEQNSSEPTGCRKRTLSKASHSDTKKGRGPGRESRQSKRDRAADCTPDGVCDASSTATTAVTTAIKVEAPDTPTGAKGSNGGGGGGEPLAKKSKTPKPSVKVKTEKAEKTPKTPKENATSRRLATSVDKDTVESERSFMNKISVKFRLDDCCKNCIVNDHDLINRQKMLITIPAKKTIQEIMSDFIIYSEGTKYGDRVTMFCEGIQEYFNTSLGKVLLYKFERNQYAQIIKSNGAVLTLKREQLSAINDLESKLKEKQYVRIYGAIHLVRLFTKLGDMMAYSDICKSTMKYIVKLVEDFTKFISKHPEYLSIDNYYVASPDYLRLSSEVV